MFASTVHVHAEITHTHVRSKSCITNSSRSRKDTALGLGLGLGSRICVLWFLVRISAAGWIVTSEERVNGSIHEPLFCHWRTSVFHQGDRATRTCQFHLGSGAPHHSSLCAVGSVWGRLRSRFRFRAEKRHQSYDGVDRSGVLRP